MNIAEKAFIQLFPEKDLSDYKLNISYSGKFRGYNANVRYRFSSYSFNLATNWKKIDESIVIGLLQSLMLRSFKEKKETMNIQLYNNFMKHVHISIAKKDKNSILEESFDRVNEKYFEDFVEKPNLKLADSTTKLGSYDFGTDTITISKNLLQDQEALDYVMYHEMLHKKHKFNFKNGRSYHHTRNFRQKEREFENSKEIEQRLKRIAVKRKIKQSFWFG